MITKQQFRSQLHGAKSAIEVEKTISALSIEQIDELSKTIMQYGEWFPLHPSDAVLVLTLASLKAIRIEERERNQMEGNLYN